MRKRHVKRGFRDLVQADLELMPLMNLFIALIPMLLLSAVFIEVSVIHANSPAEAAEEPAPDEEPSLLLAITILDEHYVVEGDGDAEHVITRSGGDAESRLAEVLRDIVARHPKQEEILLLCRFDTRYEDIITVMDVARESGLPAISLVGTGGGS